MYDVKDMMQLAIDACSLVAMLLEQHHAARAAAGTRVDHNDDAMFSS